MYVDQISMYCDFCESYRQVSVNVESYAIQDSISASVEGSGWEVWQEKGKDDIVSCPSCIE